MKRIALRCGVHFALNIHKSIQYSPTVLPVDSASVVFTCAATLNLVLEKQIFEDGGFGRGHSWDSNVAYEP